VIAVREEPSHTSTKVMPEDRRYAIITSNESDSYCCVLQIPKYFKNIPVGYASATAFQWSSSNAALKLLRDHCYLPAGLRRKWKHLMNCTKNTSNYCKLILDKKRKLNWKTTKEKYKLNGNLFKFNFFDLKTLKDFIHGWKSSACH